jgi:hypothetical protein
MTEVARITPAEAHFRVNKAGSGPASAAGSV